MIREDVYIHLHFKKCWCDGESLKGSGLEGELYSSILPSLLLSLFLIGDFRSSFYADRNDIAGREILMT